MSKRMTRWVVGLVVAGVMMAPGALAWYADTETSFDNVFGAGTLDMTLRALNDVIITGLVFDVEDMMPEDVESASLKVKNDGSLDFTYKGWFDQTGGDVALCDALDLEAELNGGLVYSGPLSGFIENPAGDIVSGDDDTWEFTVSLTDGDAALENLSCEFDWVFKAWQLDSDGTWGFTDIERAGNQISTGTWALSEGDVVINEIMWMGSDVKPSDEWIELRNMTGNDIDIAKWTIDNAKSGGNTLQIIPSSQILPANGFTLIAKNPETNANTALNAPVDVVNGALSLKNDGNGNLVLRDSFGNKIDEAKGDTWPEGLNGDEKQSMERNDVPGDGALAGSWHTCMDAGCNDGTFWDAADGDNYGTPGAANLSENDPTSEDYTGPPVEEESSEEPPVVDELTEAVVPVVGATEGKEGSEGEEEEGSEGGADSTTLVEDELRGAGGEGSEEGAGEEETTGSADGKENEVIEGTESEATESGEVTEDTGSEGAESSDEDPAGDSGSEDGGSAGGEDGGSGGEDGGEESSTDSDSEEGGSDE